MPKLIGLEWDEPTAFDVQNKGWYEQAQLLLDDGTLVPSASGSCARLTEEAIRHAVQELITNGFF